MQQEERVELPYLEKPEDVAEFNEALRISRSYREACVSKCYDKKYWNIRKITEKVHNIVSVIGNVCRTFQIRCSALQLYI